MIHKHICDVCEEEITNEQINNNEVFESLQDCEEDECGLRHVECQQELDEDLAAIS